MAKIRKNRKQWAMVGGDIVLLFLALFLALFVRRLEVPTVALFSQHLNYFAFIFTTWVLIFFINGLYDIMKSRNSSFFYATFAESLAAGVLLAALYFYLLPHPAIEPRTILLIFTGVYALLFLAWRSLLNRYIASKALRQRVLFIGAQSEAYELIDAINAHPQFGYEVIALFEPEGNPPPEPIHHITWLHSSEELKSFVKEKKVTTIVVATAAHHKEQIAHELFETMFWGIEITDVISFYETILGRIPVTALSEAWFLENIQEVQKRHYDAVKILMDYILGIIVGLTVLPFLPFVLLAIYLEDKGPVMYHQTRVGKNGKLFTIYKLRTMRTDAERDGAQFAENNDPRVTTVGRILRKTRIDELPQLFNIFKGDMTFIGPRPERPEFVAHFSEVIPFYAVRNLVKPGLTGWAQINYPYFATVGENVKKLQFDLYYIKNRSIFLDVRIILKTINTVVRWLGV